jgi:hypothetical protein
MNPVLAGAIRAVGHRLAAQGAKHRPGDIPWCGWPGPRPPAPPQRPARCCRARPSKRCPTGARIHPWSRRAPGAHPAAATPIPGGSAPTSLALGGAPRPSAPCRAAPCRRTPGILPGVRVLACPPWRPGSRHTPPPAVQRGSRPRAPADDRADLPVRAGLTATGAALLPATAPGCAPASLSLAAVAAAATESTVVDAPRCPPLAQRQGHAAARSLSQRAGHSVRAHARCCRSPARGSGADTSLAGVVAEPQPSRSSPARRPCAVAAQRLWAGSSRRVVTARVH